MKLKISAIIAVCLVAVYGLIGFLVLPSIVKPKLLDRLASATHRPVSLGKLSINPFALSVTVEDFLLKDKDSTTLVSFKKLYVNYELRSLFQNAYVFSAFGLDSPYVAVRVLQNGKLSIADLTSAAGGDTATTQRSGSKGLVIDDLWILGGKMVYEDRSRPQPMVKALDSLDLKLTHFSTLPREGTGYEFEAETRQREKLHWKGSLSLVPLKSSGLVELSGVHVRTLWEFMANRLKFEVKSGMMNLRSDYTLDASTDTSRLQLSGGSVDVADLVLGDSAETLAPVECKSVHAGGITFDFPRKEVVIGEIDAANGALRTGYLKNGTITLQDLLTPYPDPQDTVPSTMTVVVKKLATSAIEFTLVDKAMEPDAPTVISGIAVEVTDFTYGKPGDAHVKGSGVLNGGGTLSVDGTLSMMPQKADMVLYVKDSPLPALQPYVARYSRAILAAGTFGLDGHLAYASQGKKMSMHFNGSVSSAKGRIEDPVLHEALTRWDRVEMRKVDYQYDPASLTIAEIVATAPYARVIVSPDRSINVQNVIPPDTGVVQGSSAATSAAIKDTVTKTKAAKQMLMTVGQITIRDGSMIFSDLSLSPNFAISIESLGGSIKGISSQELSRADVDLNGKVDKYAPATIKGEINPLTENAFTDILLRFEGIEMTSFTPYFSKFAGYKIEQGKLSLDLRYKLNKRYLEAQNKVVVNQLTLGEKVDSPDATSLPVKLAIALLKDSKGVIDLDIPVSGSLDDPEFSFFPIIWKAVVNLLWKLVTAPFRLLGSLFGGGGDDLQYAAFRPGVDTLSGEEFTKLEKVAKGLVARPELQLELKGTASPGVDRDALAEQAIMAKIRPSGGAGQLGESEKALVLSLYKQTFKEDARAQGASDSAAFVLAYKRLVDSVKVTDNDLRGLAQRRAAAIMQYLAGKGGITPARIFLQDVETSVGPTEGEIRSMLNLTAK